MSDLILYDRISDPQAAVREWGEILAKGRLLGCETVQQGQALILMAMSERMGLFEIKRRYHIVEGQLSMRADFMRAEFRRLGGVYTWLKTGEDGIEAKIRVKFKENELEYSYTIDMAKREGLIKSKSRWEKEPGSMLRARCSTNSIRMVASEVLAGFPTDEEVGNDLNEKAAAEDVRNQTAEDAVIVEVKTSPTAPPTVKTEPAKPQTSALPDRAPDIICHAPGTRMVEREQKEAIHSIVATLGLHDALEAGLKKRGVSSVNSLTFDQAAEILGKLESARAKAEAAKQAADVTGESTLPVDATVAMLAGPCSADQVERCKRLIVELQQSSPGVSITAKIKEKLLANGMQKVAELSMGDMDRLLQSLAMKTLERWCESQLTKPTAAETTEQTEGN